MLSPASHGGALFKLFRHSKKFIWFCFPFFDQPCLSPLQSGAEMPFYPTCATGKSSLKKTGVFSVAFSPSRTFRLPFRTEQICFFLSRSGFLFSGVHSVSYL